MRNEATMIAGRIPGVNTTQLAPAVVDPRFSSGRPPMLSPHRAWQILRHRTGGEISLATFYRWLGSGKISCIRLGARIFIPWPSLDDFIERCLRGGDS